MSDALGFWRDLYESVYCFENNLLLLWFFSNVLLPLPQLSVGLGAICKGSTFWFKKVLLKLSSIVKLRNFDKWDEDDCSSTTSFGYISLQEHCRVLGYYQIGVGYCFIHSKAMRRPDYRIKQ